MSFDEALSENRIPPRVGDLLLRSEPGRLIGETSRNVGMLRWSSLLLRCVSLGMGLLAVTSLLCAGTWQLAVVELALSGVALFAASRIDARRARRRFVLHFASEVLRLELLPRGGGIPRHDAIPFDAVTSVDLVEELGVGFAIRIHWREGEGSRSELLLRGASAAEGETVHRVWRMLRNAFGLDGTSLPGDSGHVV